LTRRYQIKNLNNNNVIDDNKKNENQKKHTLTPGHVKQRVLSHHSLAVVTTHPNLSMLGVSDSARS
jgi:hypothetical protein